MDQQGRGGDDHVQAIMHLTTHTYSGLRLAMMMTETETARRRTTMGRCKVDTDIRVDTFLILSRRLDGMLWHPLGSDMAGYAYQLVQHVAAVTHRLMNERKIDCESQTKTNFPRCFRSSGSSTTVGCIEEDGPKNNVYMNPSGDGGSMGG